MFQAIQTWITYRDSQRAARVFSETLKVAPALRATQLQAYQLRSIVPEPVLSTMEGRARKCWERFDNVLNGQYLPDEVDEATASVKACICRELSRIRELNAGVLPAGDLQLWWETYCN